VRERERERERESYWEGRKRNRKVNIENRRALAAKPLSLSLSLSLFYNKCCRLVFLKHTPYASFDVPHSSVSAPSQYFFIYSQRIKNPQTVNALRHYLLAAIVFLTLS